MERGFIASLLDFSFSELVTPKIVGVLYAIGIIVGGIGAIALIFMINILDSSAILFAIVLALLAFFLNIIVIRLLLETIIVLFKIFGGIMALRRSGALHHNNLSQSFGGHSKIDIDL